MGGTETEKRTCMIHLRLLSSSEAAVSCHSLGVFCAVAENGVGEVEYTKLTVFWLVVLFSWVNSVSLLTGSNILP